MWRTERGISSEIKSGLGICIFLASLGLASDVRAQQDFATIPDEGFAVAPLGPGPFTGLHFAIEDGPSGGPYQPNEFFLGVVPNEGNGTWFRRDNVFGLCFNLPGCNYPRYVPNEYDFTWDWESGFQAGATWPTLIENNVNVTYADGTTHRPWAFDINTDQKNAVLNFSSTPGNVTFQINQNGNVVIGPPFEQPQEQLEVVGSALFTQNVSVSGNVTVGGHPVVRGSASASFGPLQWGISDGVQINSASAVCAASQLSCQSAVLPNGTQLSCSQLQPQGAVFFALCQ